MKKSEFVARKSEATSKLYRRGIIVRSVLQYTAVECTFPILIGRIPASKVMKSSKSRTQTCT
jgi:hypothetical protein